MALLNVVSIANPTIAAAGNRNAAQILVSVTDPAGAPVSGLSASNIKIDTLLVGPGGSNLVQSGFGGATFPGYYRVDVVPTGTLNWARGEFDVAVMVTRGTDRGQTLASFRIP